MATRLYDAISKKGDHEIGDLNTKWAKGVANGAKALEDIDNYTIVEIAGYDDDGNLTCQQLKDVKNKGYLATTVEEEQLMSLGGYEETYTDFYNAKDEMVRLTILNSEVRFETSAFELNSGVKKVERGMVAHFDPSKKKYIISDSKSPHASYTNACNKFEVVNEDSDFGYALDKPTIRLKHI